MPRNSLDLTFSKKIGKIVEIKAGIQDMLNSKVEYKQFVQLTDAKGGKSEREQLIRSYRPGVDILSLIHILLIVTADDDYLLDIRLGRLCVLS